MQHPIVQMYNQRRALAFKPKADQHLDVPFIRARELTFVAPSEVVFSDHIMMTCLSIFFASRIMDQGSRKGNQKKGNDPHP
jgi:hypothetical protein